MSTRSTHAEPSGSARRPTRQRAALAALLGPPVAEVAPG